MDSTGFKRKLTAILSADVAGYSRLMGENEEATVRTLNRYKEIISGLIEQNNGRLVDSPGDNVLAEFASVVDAVKCAVQVQKDLKEKNEELSSNRKMEFRIGINIGDVIQDGGRIYGDGVNVAARIESLTEPGGICISRTAYDQVKKKLDIDYEYLGEYEVKNINEPVRVYKVLIESISGDVLQKEKLEEEVSTGRKPSTLSETPSIAVLPFIDLSPEKDQEYFADGIAEELLNSLTRISELEVRGRTSSFYFKDKNEGLRTIGKMLNVAYILEGSVRKAGEKVRITVQLINTLKDAHIWSKTYDRTIEDIFVIQDDIAQSVADVMQITLGVGELGRAPGMTRNIAAYDAYLAGSSLMRQIGRENISQAIEQLEKAIALDPDFAIGWKALANVYSTSILFIPEKAHDFTEKRNAANSRVVELIPETDIGLIVAASQSGDMFETERLYKKAISLAPDNYITNYEYAYFLMNTGRPAEAIDYYKRLARIEPLDSSAYLGLGLAYDLSGNIEIAAIAFKKGRELTGQSAHYNLGLLVLAMEENNRALIDECMALIVHAGIHGNINRSDIRDINQVMHTLLDRPEEVVAELKLFMADPAYNNLMNRLGIATWASYFAEHEIALQIYKKSGVPFFTMWRPIHKGMRQLPGFKDFVRDIGLVDYWRKSGNWGDFCQPVGDDNFMCD